MITVHVASRLLYFYTQDTFPRQHIATKLASFDPHSSRDCRSVSEVTPPIIYVTLLDKAGKTTAQRQTIFTFAPELTPTCPLAKDRTTVLGRRQVCGGLRTRTCMSSKPCTPAGEDITQPQNGRFVRRRNTTKIRFVQDGESAKIMQEISYEQATNMSARVAPCVYQYMYISH